MGLEVSCLLLVFDKGLHMVFSICSVFPLPDLASSIALRGDMGVRDISWYDTHLAIQDIDQRIARRQSERLGPLASF